jgi:hypothetical protein
MDLFAVFSNGGKLFGLSRTGDDINPYLMKIKIIMVNF